MAEIVRLIRYEELDELLELYRQLHPEDIDVRQIDSLRNLWDEIIKDENLFYVVVDVDETIVSSCTLAIIKNMTRGLRPFAVIENVVTRIGYRKKGYGTKALRKAVEIAKEKNCYKVMLLTGSKEEETLRFYENAGFERGIKTGFIINL